MSGFIECEILGVQQLLRNFEKYGKESEMAIDKAVDDTSKGIESDAKKRLSGMFGSAKHWISGRLATSIYNRIVKIMEKVVGTNVSYAPCIEFGTGDLVDIPIDVEEIAAQYKGKGIRKVNIKGDSFLNWAAVNQSKKFIERLIKNLNAIK